MFILYAIIIFALLIFIHELGHFLTAKLSKVKVNEFSLGMGPAFFKKQGKETLYSLRAIPIGGYCQLEGEDEKSDDPNAFSGKPAYIKAIILFAGSFMNFLLAILLVSLMIFSIGEVSNKIGSVETGSPAKLAGLKKNDQIIKVNNKNLNEITKLRNLINSSKNKALKINVLRDGKNKDLYVVPKKNKDGTYMIGITWGMSHSFGYFFKSFYLGTKSIFYMCGKMYEALFKLITGKESVKNLTGPVGIVNVIAKSSNQGFIFLVNIAALISLNLAIVNLLPFPALDGGRLLLLVLRKFFKKNITDKIESKIHFVGIIVLFSLMILITFKDIVSLF